MMRSMGLRVVLRFPPHSWKHAFLSGCFCVYNKAFVYYQNLMGHTSANEPLGKGVWKGLRFKIIIMIKRIANEMSCLSIFHSQSHGSLVRKRQTGSIIRKRLQTAMSLRGDIRRRCGFVWFNTFSWHLNNRHSFSEIHHELLSPHRRQRRTLPSSRPEYSKKTNKKTRSDEWKCFTFWMVCCVTSPLLLGRADENATDIFVMWEIKAASFILIFNSSSAAPSVWLHSLVIVKKHGGAGKYVSFFFYYPERKFRK